MDADCLFCGIYEEGSEVIYEDEFFYARYDLFPVTAGHAEIIPKRHIASLDELDGDEWEQLQSSIDAVREIVEENDLSSIYREMVDEPLDENSEELAQDVLDSGFAAETPDAYNLGVNDGQAAGRTIDHLHIHVIPRYDGDMEDPRGGVRHVIPEKGNYKD